MAVSFNDITNMANVMSSAGQRYNQAQNARRLTDIQAGTLGLAQRNQQFKEKQALIEQARADVSTIRKNMADLVAGGILDTDPVRGKAVIETLAGSLERLYAAGSGDLDAAREMAQMDVQTALNTPSLVERGRLAGEAEGAGQAARDIAIGAEGATGRQALAGIAATEAQAANAAAQAAARRQETATDTRNFVGPNGQRLLVRTSDPNAQQQIDEAKALGFIEMAPVALQAATARDLDLTSSVQTGLQNKQIDAVEALNALDEVNRGVQETPEAVGFSGSIIENVQNNLIAQVFDDAFNPEVSKVRENIRLTRESLLRDISDDDRFNLADRKMISEALPETGIFESAPEAQSKTRMVAALIARRLASSAQLGMGQAAKILPVDDIKRMFINGTIDKNTAINLLRTIHGAS